VVIKGASPKTMAGVRRELKLAGWSDKEMKLVMSSEEHAQRIEDIAREEKHEVKSQRMKELRKRLGKDKGPTKTSKLVELLKSGWKSFEELLSQTEMSKLGLRSMLYYHLKKKGMVVDRKDGKFTIKG